MDQRSGLQYLRDLSSTVDVNKGSHTNVPSPTAQTEQRYQYIFSRHTVFDDGL